VLLEEYQMRIMFEPLAGAIGLGAITRCVAIAQQAVLRGHTVAFHAQDYPLLRSYPVGKRIDAPVPVRPAGSGDPQSATFNEALHIRGLVEPEYLRAAVRSDLAAIESFRPDVIVTEWQPSVPIAAAVTGTPFAATLATTELSEYIGEPVDPGFPDVDANVAGVCREFNVPETPRFEYLLHGTSRVNFAPTMPILEPLLGAVPNTRYVGALLFPPLELAEAPPLPEHRRKIVAYVGAGAVRMRDMLPVLAKAFPGPEYAVLVAARETSVDGSPLPYRYENVVVAHEPGLTRALQGADLVVARGSQNAICTALLAGVPVIGTPGTRDAEPAFNLGVLQAHGAAFTLHGTPTAADLSDAAERLRAEGAARRAGLLGDLLRGYGGSTQAVRELESVV
jgi:UDP:flavonoid glycosyltransferase YjiC (YdhE family)